MPDCVFCRRTGLPRVPLTPPDLTLTVAHVGPDGEPCREGSTPEVHGQSLGADYPHEALLVDNDAWSLTDTDSKPTYKAVTKKPKRR